MIKVTLFKSVALSLALICIVFASIAMAQIDGESAQNVNVPVNVAEIETEKRSTGYNRQLIKDLEAQHELVLTALQEENTFSLKLSEVYTEYGDLLLASGRVEEANDVYTQALHIQKVNHGIYATEQIYFLKKLIETAVELDDLELVERYLSKANAIERKNEDFFSEHLAQMFLLAGHFYIDKHYLHRRYGNKLPLLRTARRYIENAFTLYQNNAVSVESLPYGELLLVGYLESTLQTEMRAVVTRLGLSGSPSPGDGRDQFERDYRYVFGAYRRSLSSFRDYVRKARADDNLHEEINATLFWADTLVLFKRHSEAAKYYKIAWDKSQKIYSDEQLNSQFNQPQLIPAYRYLMDSDSEADSIDGIPISLTFSVARNGSVSNIKLTNQGDSDGKYLARAKNEVVGLSFRPAIINGNTIAVEEFPYEVTVLEN